MMNDILKLLDAPFAGNSLLHWVLALFIAFATWSVLVMLRRVLAARFANAYSTSAVWDDALLEIASGTHRLLILPVAIYVASLELEVSVGVRKALNSGLAIALILQGGLWLNRLLVMWLQRSRARLMETDPSSIAAINALGFAGRLVLWSVILLLTLDNLGINVTALVTGLGVGGIAMALAVQNILGDLFASFSIALDKPFAVGDFLIIDDHLGSVEYIGLKTTRLRSLSGEQLVFSNTDLLRSRIRNYGRMYERRIVFKLGVTYQTPRDKLEAIPGIIREAIEAQDKVRFDRSHFQSYGDFALAFETVYYVLEPDYNLYMDIQQAIYLRIHARFEEQGIEFAYPTQTIFVERAASASA